MLLLFKTLPKLSVDIKPNQRKNKTIIFHDHEFFCICNTLCYLSQIVQLSCQTHNSTLKIMDENFCCEIFFVFNKEK